MTFWYLDASVALHAVLPAGRDAVRRWLDDVPANGGELCSSSLLRLEIVRTLRREALPLGRANPVLDRLREISVDDGVLRFAAAIEPHVTSLDAIHLATAALLGPDVTVVTHDTAMGRVARHLGLDALDPLVWGEGP